MGSDIAGFAISIAALYLSKWPATSGFSYGLARVEILGAVLSTFMIWILTGFLLLEAFDRVRTPTEIDAKVMFVTALIGVWIF
ncbi:hypothetical protein HDU76_000345 [Blyttiomyces sp. JEL0837]|nr:hypothetical protein HDU76_000345 [Blyttiomyces sp. JEL0837]